MAHCYKPPIPIHVMDQVTPKYRNRFSFRAALVESCTTYRYNLEHNSFGYHVQLHIPNTNEFEPIPGEMKWEDRNQFEISDRSFGPGSWVTRDGNVGQVQSVSVRADLQVISKPVVALNVPAERLIPIEKFPEGSIILYDSWCGRVMKSDRLVTVNIGTDEEEDPYVGVINYRLTGEIFKSKFRRECPAFRSQKIKGLWQSLKDADWERVKSGKKSTMDFIVFEGRVSDVEVEFLEVEWATNIGEPDRPEPPTKLTADLFESIDLVDPPDYSSFRLGNVRYFEPSEDDELVYLDSWFGRTTYFLPDKNAYVGQRCGVQCLQTYTTVDVLWKDGSSGTLKGVDLEPYTANMADFIRGDVVTGPRVISGIVQSAMHKLKKVEVKQFGTQILITEMASELKIQEGFQLYPQNIVFRSREDVTEFISGWVVQCQNDGQIMIQCHGTGDVKLLAIPDLSCPFLDPRHSNPAPTPFMSRHFKPIAQPPQSVVTNNSASPSTSAEIVPGPIEISSNTLLPDRFVIKCSQPNNHFFKNETSTCTGNINFMRAIGREMKRMKKELLNGTFVIGYQHRLDLFSIILVGPPNTPFDGQLLFFDMFLPSGFPADPPRFRYKPFANVQILGKVNQRKPFYVHELLGETWDPTQKYGLVDILTCLREIVFVPEPYYNNGTDARKEMKDCAKGDLNSRRFNERIVSDFVLGTQTMLDSRPWLGDWEPELLQIWNYFIPRMVDRVEGWADGGRCEFRLQAVSPSFKSEMKTRLPAISKKLKEITCEEST